MSRLISSCVVDIFTASVAFVAIWIILCNRCSRVTRQTHKIEIRDEYHVIKVIISFFSAHFLTSSHTSYLSSSAFVLSKFSCKLCTMWLPLPQAQVRMIRICSSLLRKISSQFMHQTKPGEIIKIKRQQQTTIIGRFIWLGRNFWFQIN